MRRYETIAIVDPDISENDRTALLSRIKEIIPQQAGVMIQEDLWGTRKLAYPIKKKPRGYYARFDYCGMGKAVEELERFFRIDDRVLKYMTVLLNPDADPEQIKAEMAEVEGASASASKTEVAEPDQAPAAEAKKEPVDAKPAASDVSAAAEAKDEPVDAKPAASDVSAVAEAKDASVDEKPAETNASTAAGDEPKSPAPADETATETSEKE